GSAPAAPAIVRARSDEVSEPSSTVLPAGDVTPAAGARTKLGRSRNDPAAATFLSRTRLNKAGSEKETWHIDFDLAESGLDYVAGDSFGVFPKNDPALVDGVIKALRAPPDFPIAGRTLRQVLIDSVSLNPAPDMLFPLF